MFLWMVPMVQVQAEEAEDGGGGYVVQGLAATFHIIHIHLYDTSYLLDSQISMYSYLERLLADVST